MLLAGCACVFDFDVCVCGCYGEAGCMSIVVVTAGVQLLCCWSLIGLAVYEVCVVIS